MINTGANVKLNLRRITMGFTKQETEELKGKLNALSEHIKDLIGWIDKQVKDTEKKPAA